MPRRPRPAHRVPPSRIRKSDDPAPPLSTKAKIISKVQFGESNSKSARSKVTLEVGGSFSEDSKQRFREEYELGTRRDALKRMREEEDEDEDEDEEVDVETDVDVDVDADAPRVVQWLDDEDETLPGRSWEDELKQKVADEVPFLSSLLTICWRPFWIQETLEASAYSNILLNWWSNLLYMLRS